MPIINLGGSGGGGGFQPVTVTTDWSNADNAWTDIQSSTGLAGRVVAGADLGRLEICLWEGEADSDDYARIFVDDNTPNYFDSFDSAPSSGTAYIVGVRYLTETGFD